ncbi:F0F1 ATP synthase subunit alpha [candidate division WOR-1 bacterium RIFOXYB2_FULL_48_7]|uniref:ATP synthase subunit alpha n=1 Tax=candidate division WOR-1 bacterium RIFOXYB2_FULL_48_7 TaxID=1802583 RepID=A0A1F4TJ70_UNCSA|nr:MAG: F0F1 ATP synthase subunit alpha [candidate division WOR-1 bacterium RIFOXYB2_FULL_48_7]
MPEKIDLSQIIKRGIAEFSPESKIEKVGVVVESGDGIIHIAGLPNAMAGEMIDFPNGYTGMVFDLEREIAQAVLFGPHTAVREGDFARCTGRVMQVPVGDALIGRVVNPLGQPIDGGGEIKTTKFRPVERLAPGVIDRQPVNQPLQTGYKLIDALIPIGRGQRELIIGDRATGKTTLAIDTIINQKGQDVICIYVAIGQKASTIANQISRLKEYGALDYTIVVAASAGDSVAYQYIAPYAGCAMGEEFMLNGRDVLIIYDDLTKHAQAYRMISLLLRRPPGREAYPGDVFYLHSRLLERSAKLRPEAGGGSMTALPLVETQLGDVTSYIPTNIISITDGQIFLETDLFNAGIRPAVNVGISVSRVGGKAQVKAIRQIAGRLRLDLAQYREKQAFSLFASEVGEETRQQLRRGALMTEILKQDKHLPLPVEDQVIVIYAATTGVLDEIDLAKVKSAEKRLINFVYEQAPELKPKLAAFSAETESRLKELMQKFKESI